MAREKRRAKGRRELKAMEIFSLLVSAKITKSALGFWNTENWVLTAIIIAILLKTKSLYSSFS